MGVPVVIHNPDGSKTVVGTAEVVENKETKNIMVEMVFDSSGGKKISDQIQSDAIIGFSIDDSLDEH